MIDSACLGVMLGSGGDLWVVVSSRVWMRLVKVFSCWLLGVGGVQLEGLWNGGLLSSIGLLRK